MKLLVQLMCKEAFQEVYLQSHATQLIWNDWRTHSEKYSEQTEPIIHNIRMQSNEKCKTLSVVWEIQEFKIVFTEQRLGSSRNTLKDYFFKTHFNIIFSPTSWTVHRSPPSKLVFHMPVNCILLHLAKNTNYEAPTV